MNDREDMSMQSPNRDKYVRIVMTLNFEKYQMGQNAAKKSAQIRYLTNLSLYRLDI